MPDISQILMEVKMETDMKELEAYESIIQNLMALIEEATGTKPKEVEAIGVIMHTLSDLRDRLRGPNLPMDSIIQQVKVACSR